MDYSNCAFVEIITSDIDIESLNLMMQLLTWHTDIFEKLEYYNSTIFYWLCFCDYMCCCALAL